MTQKQIYLDHAATTYLDPRVKKEMDFILEKVYANPGSLHQYGLKAKELLGRCRTRIAEIIKADSSEIIFILFFEITMRI